VDVVLTDLKMADMTGLELCERIVSRRPDVPVVVMTAFGTIETAIAAIRVGAYDFITKPVETDALVVTLERALSIVRFARRWSVSAGWLVIRRATGSSLEPPPRCGGCTISSIASRPRIRPS